MSDILLELEGVETFYGRLQVLFGISFCSASQSSGGKNISRENGTT